MKIKVRGLYKTLKPIGACGKDTGYKFKMPAGIVLKLIPSFSDNVVGPALGGMYHNEQPVELVKEL